VWIAGRAVRCAARPEVFYFRPELCFISDRPRIPFSMKLFFSVIISQGLLGEGLAESIAVLRA